MPTPSQNQISSSLCVERRCMWGFDHDALASYGGNRWRGGRKRSRLRVCAGCQAGDSRNGLPNIRFQAGRDWVKLDDGVALRADLEHIRRSGLAQLAQFSGYRQTVQFVAFDAISLLVRYPRFIVKQVFRPRGAMERLCSE